MSQENKIPEIKWTVKSEWYDLDKLYLLQNPNMLAFKTINNISSFNNIYFNYFSEDAIINKIKSICQYYNNGNFTTDREYKYLKMDKVNEFIDDMVDIILFEFEKQNSICK